MAKPVRLRRLAAEDIDAALDHYRSEAGHDVAARFVGSVERAITHVGRRPHHGSLRFAYELEIPDLRCWPLPRFPYLVMYVERDTEVDVWRVLHTRRDIPSTLADSTDQHGAWRSPTGLSIVTVLVAGMRRRSAGSGHASGRSSVVRAATSLVGLHLDVATARDKSVEGVGLTRLDVVAVAALQPVPPQGLEP